ncbi:MAG: hypothetical protein ICV62_15735 [Cyanobacteria bacterium Co-bin13]|nr:hypothetical protein [Cyanobacteria bacterium Co-bin13]
MSSVSSPDPSATAATSLLSDPDWQRLNLGQVVLLGEKGQYAVMGLAKVSAAIAWSVLTDYSSFDRFVPTIAASRIVETDGARSVVEQIDRRRILLSTVETTILTENIEMDQQQISFRLLEGNLKYMYGHWRIESIDWNLPYPEAVLISQQVKAEADLGPFKKMFYKLFEASLIETMEAIRDEMERRGS